MFYQKIDLRKLYEQADEPVSMDGDPGIVDSLEGGEPQAAEEFPTEEEMIKKEAVDIAKGRAYAFPVSEETYAQLNDLIAKGSGDWMSKEPLKFPVVPVDDHQALLPKQLVGEVARSGSQFAVLQIGLAEEIRQGPCILAGSQ